MKIQNEHKNCFVQMDDSFGNQKHTNIDEISEKIVKHRKFLRR